MTVSKWFQALPYFPTGNIAPLLLDGRIDIA